MKTHQKNRFQIIWGIMLLVAGVGLFFRVPQIMPKIQQIESLASSIVFIRVCFYLIGCLLIGGGIKKIRDNYKSLDSIGNQQSQK